MPANKKHLSPTFLHRLSRISAGLLGGYLVTASFFLALSYLLDRASVIYSLVFGGFLLWVALLILAFIAEKGWKIWLVYSLLTFCFSTVVYFCQSSPI